MKAWIWKYSRDAAACANPSADAPHAMQMRFAERPQLGREEIANWPCSRLLCIT
jgi:hypothetical protein